MTLASISSEPTSVDDSSEPNVLSPTKLSGESDGEATILHGVPPGADEVLVTVKQSALLQIDEHCNSDWATELGGVLLGKSIDANGRLSVEVAAALPVVTDDHGPVHFTFTADAWTQLHHDRSSQYPHLEVVGWYHTHPDLGVFFSADDIVVQSAAFSQPWHVALVVDPVRSEACLFGWEQRSVEEDRRTLSPISGYVELLDDQPSTVVGWRMVQSAVWYQENHLMQDTGPSSQVYVPANDWPALPPVNPWWGVVLGGLSLLISLLLLLERLLASG
jgi:proteasome lid subunit RPN8/RPN11